MTLALMIALWLGSSLAVVRTLTQRARHPFAEPPPVVAWGKFEPLRLATADGEELGAWYLPGAKRQPVVLLLHGNGGSRSSCLTQAEICASAGYGLLMLTMRAHGDSTGTFNDIGWSAQKDVLAARAWLKKIDPERPVVVWGQSLGSAAAVFAAKDLDSTVAGYILECPYQNLAMAVRSRTRRALPPPLDSVAYLGLWAVAPVFLGDLSRYSPLQAVPNIPEPVPVLILTGSADSRALPAEAQALHERIRSHARLVTIDSGEHLELPQADPSGYREVILGFLGEIARATDASGGHDQKS